MARFGQGFVRQATQPAYLEGLFNLGKTIGGVSREKERMATQNKLVAMDSQATAMSEQGDVSNLNRRREELVGMLTQAKDKETREMIQDRINNIEGLKQVALPKSRNRDLMNVVRGESSIKEIDSEISRLEKDTSAEGQIKLDAARKAKAAIQQRLDSLKDDPTLMAEVAQYEYDVELKTLTQENEMFNQKKLIAARELATLTPGTDNYKAKVAELETSGFGVVVKEFEKQEAERQTALLTYEKLKEENRPLNPTELKHAKELNLPIEGKSPMAAKTIYLSALAELSKKSLAVSKAMRSVTAMDDAEGQAVVEKALQDMSTFAEEFYPGRETIDEYIEDMSPEEKQMLYGLVKGKTREEVPGIINDYFRVYAPEAFQRMQEKFGREKSRSEATQSALTGIAEATNAARGTEAFKAGLITEDRPLEEGEEGYFDINNPDDADRAMLIYEREETKARNKRLRDEQVSATTNVGLTSRSGFNF